MPRSLTGYTVFIASPSDLAEEREVAKDVIATWNRTNSDATDVTLRVRLWELDAVPELGDRPQGILNRQLVDESDILVAMFWTKVGTPTEVAASGTVEEIERFVASGKPVLLYFSDRDPPPGADAAELAKVRALREVFHSRGICGSYRTPEEFKSRLLEHLSKRVHKLRGSDQRVAPSVSQPGLLHDDLFVLAALAENDEEWGDHPEPWRHAPSGIDIAIRTGLSEAKVRDSIEVMSGRGLVAAMPFGHGEKGGSRFPFRCARLTAEGRRLFDSTPSPGRLPGKIFPDAEYVPEDYPDKSGLRWDEQARGYKVEWVDETMLPGLVKRGIDPVVTDIGGRPRRLRHRSKPNALVLVRSLLRPKTVEEAAALIQEKVRVPATVSRQGDEFVAKKLRTVPSALGGPPAIAGFVTIANGSSIHEVLANLKIPLEE